MHAFDGAPVFAGCYRKTKILHLLATALACLPVVAIGTSLDHPGLSQILRGSTLMGCATLFAIEGEELR